MINPTTTIYYSCSCGAAAAAAGQTNKNGLPLSNLLYCPDCLDTKCSKCIALTPVCYYCPFCMFEVPSSSVKNDLNRCIRNCLLCPSCQSTLQVNNTQAIDHHHYLQCPCCRWDSRNANLVFESATGLGNALLQLELNSSYSKQFSNIKSHLLKLVSHHHHHSSSSHDRSFTPITTSPSFNSIHRHIPSLAASQPTSPNQENTATVDPYHPTFQYLPSNRTQKFTLARDLQYVESTPTLNQLINQPPGHDSLQPLLPIRAHLRAKLSKLCGTCNKVLIKPDLKASSTQFKIRHTALAHLPKITIAQSLPVLLPNQQSRLFLSFTNPLTMDLQLSLVAHNSDHVTVELVCPQFSVPAYDSLYASNKKNVKSVSPLLFDSLNTPARGIVRVDGNIVTTELLITPCSTKGALIEFEMTVSYKLDKAHSVVSTALSAVQHTLQPSQSNRSKDISLTVTISLGTT